ncbi:SagB/ThcOx family dehydrogenase [Candidatus Micrarchaeota archaeon]|nr:SagB/ThcOx family dehydrogenase [Candidatus Micrarchaeota archaeon]MBD3418207.1 SagB/ThcOx family dehydrogenase [Candidatus Micrarchaeota archaeon]
MLGGIVVFVLFLAIVWAIWSGSSEEEVVGVECSSNPAQSEINLPEPDYSGINVEEAIKGRRSVREYTRENITVEELSMLLWAGQGITSEWGGRAAPSAGALYPIELYVMPNKVAGGSCGIYRYIPDGHKLVLVREGDFREEVAAAALGQEWIKDAAVVIIMTSVRERTAGKYGDAADRYIAMEAGHISENILLEAVSLGLGAVPVGAIDGEAMDELLGAEEGETAIYINAIGRV